MSSKKVNVCKIQSLPQCRWTKDYILISQIFLISWIKETKIFVSIFFLWLSIDLMLASWPFANWSQTYCHDSLQAIKWKCWLGSLKVISGRPVDDSLPPNTCLNNFFCNADFPKGKPEIITAMQFIYSPDIPTNFIPDDYSHNKDYNSVLCVVFQSANIYCIILFKNIQIKTRI